MVFDALCYYYYYYIPLLQCIHNKYYTNVSCTVYIWLWHTYPLLLYCIAADHNRQWVSGRCNIVVYYIMFRVYWSVVVFSGVHILNLKSSSTIGL